MRSINNSSNRIKEKFEKEKYIKDFYGFLLLLKKHGLITDEDFESIKNQLKDEEVAEYLMVEFLWFFLGSGYARLNTFISGYIGLHLLHKEDGIYVFCILHCMSSALLRLGLAVGTKHILTDEKNKIALFSLIPLLSKIVPLVVLMGKKGVTLPSYFWSWGRISKKNSQFISNLKGKKIDKKIFEDLENKITKTKKRVELIDKHISYIGDILSKIFILMKNTKEKILKTFI